MAAASVGRAGSTGKSESATSGSAVVAVHRPQGTGALPCGRQPTCFGIQRAAARTVVRIHPRDDGVLADLTGARRDGDPIAQRAGAVRLIPQRARRDLVDLAAGVEQRALDLAGREFGVQRGRQARHPRCQWCQQISGTAIPVRHPELTRGHACVEGHACARLGERSSNGSPSGDGHEFRFVAVPALRTGAEVASVAAGVRRAMVEFAQVEL